MKRDEVTIGLKVIRKARNWNSGAIQKEKRYEGVVISLPRQKASNQYEMEVDFGNRKDWVSINHY